MEGKENLLFWPQHVCSPCCCISSSNIKYEFKVFISPKCSAVVFILYAQGEHFVMLRGCSLSNTYIGILRAAQHFYRCISEQCRIASEINITSVKHYFERSPVCSSGLVVGSISRVSAPKCCGSDGEQELQSRSPHPWGRIRATPTSARLDLCPCPLPVRAASLLLPTPSNSREI